MSVLARPPIHRWNFQEWDRLVESGVFDGQRIELIGGEVVDMAPQREPHVLAVSLVAAVMRRLFAEPAYWVRAQSPLRLRRDSDPEPDVAVVKGPARDYLKSGHPKTALLVVEVSLTTADFDLGDKASLYASAGIADYWVVDLARRQCQVHRKPVKDESQRFGFGYSQVTPLEPEDSIAPLAAKNKRITVDALLP